MFSWGGAAKTTEVFLLVMMHRYL